MATPINGTEYDDNNTVNGDGKFHKALVGSDKEFDGVLIKPANDTIHGNDGHDIIYGRGGSDRLYGDNGNDKIYGDTGNGNNGSSFLTSNNDTLYGGSGEDELYGEAGNDILYGGIGEDNLQGEAGNDILYGGIGEDALYGGSGNDKMYGQANADYLFGGSGNDLVSGGFGNDYLDGANFWGVGNGIGSGTEFDILTGGAGADNFVLGNINDVYYFGNGHATITDFSLVQGDVIQIKGDFGDGYTLGLGNWGGNATQDTGIFFKDNLIGVVQDQNIANVNPNDIFVSAPPIPG